MTENGDGKKIEPEDPKEVICEFFGIKIATKNPNLAKVLKTEVGDFVQLDVHQVKDYIKNPDDFNEGDNEATDRAITMDGLDSSRESDQNSGPPGDDNDIDIDKLVREYLDRNY